MLEYLQSLEKFGINLGLKRVQYLLEKLGNPHLELEAIHIAGTNGKGSNAVMISSMLKEAGYKVGLYTSPHLLDFRERIRINGRDIPAADFAAGLKLVRKIAGRMKSKPTVFEALTAVAFWYFAKKKVDYAVLEVGLGGRLDATNVVTPLVSVITNIEREHTEVLGRTLARIAGEKAAIIKPGIPVVTAENKVEPLKVIKREAEKQGALLIQVGRRQEAEGRRQKAGGRGLQGEHQKLNAACAIAAVHLAGIRISRSAVRRGLKKADWPGRFQVISRQPLVILDGAHNPAGAKALKVTIQKQFPGRYTIVFGCQKTKDHRAMLRELRPLASNLIITRSSHKQAQDPLAIARGTKFQVADSLAEAVKQWGRKGPLLVTGSLFLVADAMKLLSYSSVRIKER